MNTIVGVELVMAAPPVVGRPTLPAPRRRVVAASGRVVDPQAGLFGVLLAALRRPHRAAKLTAVRCLIVDDSASFLLSASLLLESQGVSVVGCAASRAEALALVGALEVDVVLIDIQLGEDDGVALAGDPAVRAAVACVVLISSHDVGDVEELIAGSGAAGFLPKTALGAAALDAFVR